MTTHSRVRVKPLGAPRDGGSYTNYTDTYTAGGKTTTVGATALGAVISVGQKTCLDSVDTRTPYLDHSLNITTREGFGGSISGEDQSPKKTPTIGIVTRRIYDHFQDPHYGNPWSSGLPVVPEPSWSYWHTKAIASMQVHSAIVDVPAFVAEYMQIPAALRDLGRMLTERGPNPDDVPGQVLANSFGWNPLFHDMNTLFHFSEEVARRARVVSEASHGGSRFERNLSNTHSNTVRAGAVKATFATPTRQLVVAGESDWRTRVWFSATEKIRPGPQREALAALGREAPGRNLSDFGKLVGFSRQSSAATIWEIIPWSWLIDYFLDVGSFLTAYANQIPYEFSDFCIMQSDEITEKSSVVKNETNLVWANSSVHIGSKKRSVRVINPAFPCPQPFITGAHMGILGALITATSLRSWRRIGF